MAQAATDHPARMTEEEWQVRKDLAAAYRLVSLYGWDDLVFTHLSARVPGPEHHFLINPYGWLFDEITASSLVKVDEDGQIVDPGATNRVNPAGFTIHSAVHMAREEAGAVLHMHGELAGALCAGCGHRWVAPQEMTVGEPCPACGAPCGRPDVVWFGEMPYHMDRIFDLLETADVFAAIGTSGQVYPAAAFVHQAREAGAHTVELNLEPSEVAQGFDEIRTGPASRIVPLWVEDLLKG